MRDLDGGGAGGVPPLPGDDGLPEPPRAPEVHGSWPAIAPRGRSVVTHHEQAVGRAMGMAHLTYLEEVVVRRDDRGRQGLAAVVAYTAAPVLVFGGIGLLAGGDLIVLGCLAAFLLVAAPTVYLLATRGRAAFVLVVAGPRTLGIGTWGELDETGRHVDLPTLATVRLVERRRGGPVLRMAQHVGTARVDVPMGALEASPRLWNVVHLGLRHAATAGAEVDESTRARLRLPDAPTRPSTVDDTRSSPS